MLLSVKAGKICREVEEAETDNRESVDFRKNHRF